MLFVSFQLGLISLNVLDSHGGAVQYFVRQIDRLRYILTDR